MQPTTPPAGTTSTPPRLGNHPAAGGDPAPRPSASPPDQRAAWHQAFAAFSPASQPDVRAMPDGRLWLTRDTYAAQTAWAPRHVGKELRLSRLGAFDAALGVIRADAEADAARKTGDYDRAARHEHLATSGDHNLAIDTPPTLSVRQDRAAALGRASPCQ